MFVFRIVSEIFIVKACRDLETGGKGRSRSFKWRRSIDHIRLFIGRPFSSYLTLNNRNLEKVIEDHSNRLVPFESFGAVSYSLSIATMAISLTVYEIFSVKE